MADVSHELGALRFVVESPLSSKVAMFNKQTQQHQQQQLLNPFSSVSGRSSPKPSFSKDEYGKPLAGSLTEMRGQKANMHVLREMLELCQIIDSEGYNVKDEPTMRVIPFGELFNIYNYISDKVVGILLRARKHKLLDFEGEMLFQRRDDDVPVFLLKPIVEIRQELQAKIEEIKRGSSPAPQATSQLLDKSAHKLKLASRSLTPSASPTPSKQTTPAQSKASSPMRSKASSPAPAEPEKVEQAPATAGAAPPTAQQPTDKKDAQAPIVVPSVQVNEVVVEPSVQLNRLEGGQEQITPTEKPKEDVVAAPADASILPPAPIQPAIAEHVDVPVCTSTAGLTNPSSVENAELPTIVVDTTTAASPAAEDETAAVVPAITEADVATIEMPTTNNEQNPQA